MGYSSINIWDWSELELAWSRKNVSYFENNFPIFLLSTNSNTLIFKVCYLLHWVHFLVMKAFYNIFYSTFCWAWASNVWIWFIVSFSVNIYSYYWWKTLFILRISLLISSSTDASVGIVDDEGSFELTLKLNSHPPLYVHITLVTDTKAPSSRLSQLLQC